MSTRQPRIVVLLQRVVRQPTMVYTSSFLRLDVRAPFFMGCSFVLIVRGHLVHAGCALTFSPICWPSVYLLLYDSNCIPPCNSYCMAYCMACCIAYCMFYDMTYCIFLLICLFFATALPTAIPTVYRILYFRLYCLLYSLLYCPRYYLQYVSPTDFTVLFCTAVMRICLLGGRHGRVERRLHAHVPGEGLGGQCGPRHGQGFH